MAKPLPSLDKANLERLVDEYTVHEVLNALCDICHEKSEHVRASYQDETIANYWFKLGGLIRQCSIRVLAATKGED